MEPTASQTAHVAADVNELSEILTRLNVLDTTDTLPDEILLAGGYLIAYLRTKNITFLTQGHEQAQAAINKHEDSTQAWVTSACLLVIFTCLHLRLQPSDEEADSAIALVRSISERNGEKFNLPLHYSPCACELYLRRYNKRNNVEDAKVALSFLSEQHPRHLELLNSLADNLYRQYDTTRSVPSLSDAINHKSKALSLTNSDDLRCEYLQNLASMYWDRSKATLSDLDADLAISRASDALAIKANTDATLACIETGLSRILTFKFSLTNDTNDLAKAQSHAERAIQLTPARDPLQFDRQTDKLVAFTYWSSHTDDDQILKQAYDLAQSLLQLVEPGTERYALAALNFAKLCQERFNHNEDEEDQLKLALKYSEEAQKSIPPSSAHLATVFNSYSATLLTSHRHSENAATLVQAMQKIDEALAAERGGDTAMAEHLHIRGEILAEQASLSGRIEDYADALSEMCTSLALQARNFSKRSETIFKISSLILAMYRRKPEPKNVTACIEYAFQCLKFRPGNRRWENRVYNLLSNAYFSRFEVERGRSDLDESIRLGLRAVNNDTSSPQAEHLGNLSTKLWSRAVRYRLKSDIVEALKYIRKARGHELSTATRFGRAIIGTLSYILLDFFRFHGNPDELREAEKTCTECLQTATEVDGSQSDFLIHLGSILYERSQSLGDGPALNAAILRGQEALKCCPENYYKKGMFLTRVAVWLMKDIEKNNVTEHKVQAEQILVQALGNQHTAPMFRISAGSLASKLQIAGLDWTSAYASLRKVVDLFPEISPRELSFADQQFAMSQLSGTASVAASCARNAGMSLGDVLQVLEAGRGIIAGWQIQSRNDIGDLVGNPELAAEYLEIRDRLTKATMPTVEMIQERQDPFPSSVISELTGLSDFSKNIQTEAHRSMILQLREVEKKIRSRPGLSDFQKSLAPTEFTALAGDGPIVVVNSNSVRSDAFIVKSTGIEELELPGLKYTALASKLEDLFVAQKVTRGQVDTLGKRNAQLREFLQWLWDTIAEPILKRLAYLDTANPHGQRIIWVTNGFMSFCPLHAAGYYTQNSKRNVPHYARSTYVTSFRALKYSRERQSQPVVDRQHKPLILAMDETIGQRDLRASDEVAALTQTFSRFGYAKPETHLQPSRNSALKAMQDQQAVHFACHGYADPTDASNSHLLLHDSIQTGNPDQLSIADIVDTRNTKARLAYLSACSTAENSMVKLMDENIHLAATFQLAGFAHVVGTLWSVGDSAAVQTAAAFYNKLLSQTQDGSVPDSAVSIAVHEAVRELRETKLPGSRIRPAENVLSWVPFVHFGS